MDSNISELVKLGHERADELKAACGAVDVRSVAQLISDLASQLEVQYVRAEEAGREFRSADITMQNLEAQLKQSKIDSDCYKKGMEASNARLVQLAAENAALKSKAAELVHEASEVYSAYNSSITEHDGDFMDMQTLQEMQCVETPATDAFLAEVRAAAVDEVCLKISNAIVNCYQDEQVGLDAAATICGDFAAQIRKGVQS